MYIPIGPNKKQLYKIIILLLILVYLMFIGMYKPKALTNSARFGDVRITIPQGINYGNYVLNNSWYNFGEGEIHFSIAYDFPSSLPTSNNPLAEVHLITASNIRFKCDIGTLVTYNDSITQYVNYQVICPVDFSGTSLRQIMLITRSSDTGQANTYKISEYATYVSKDDSNYSSQITNIQNSTNDINNNLNDSSIDNSSANDFTSNSAFQDSNGLDAIIKAPLNFIQSLTNSTCNSINLTIPYIDADVSLPCMSTIYNKALGQQLVNLIALVINGVVLYRYCLKILQIVKDAKNPNKDGLEVLDL